MAKMLSGWRGLGAFWLAVLLLVGGGVVILQALGPPLPLRTEIAAVQPQAGHDSRVPTCDQPREACQARP